MIVVENSESAGPPVTALIDVRAICQQQFDHWDVSTPDGGEKDGAIERKTGQRIVESRTQLGMVFEAFSSGGDIVGCDRGNERVGRFHDQRFY